MGFRNWIDSLEDPVSIMWKCTVTFLGKVVTSGLIFSVTIVVKVQNSSDLSSGRRPLSKSDEFWTFTTMVTEKMCETAEIKCYPYSVDHSEIQIRVFGPVWV